MSAVNFDPNATIPAADASTESDAAARLAKLICRAGCEILRDDRGSNLIRVVWGGGSNIVPLPSQALRRYAVALHFAAFGETPKATAVRGAFDLLGALADRKPALAVNRRFARPDQDIWVDLGASDGSAVRVGESGWTVVEVPPVLFRRAAHQRPLVMPARGGDAAELLPFLNLSSEADQLLVLTWLVTAMIPDIAHTILVLHGPQGRAKTTLAKILRRLIDPSTLPTVSCPRRTGELTQALDQHAVLVFDNVTSLSQRMSDDLCAAATGGGFTKRRVYTADEEVIFSFKRPMILTGIPIPTTAPDFLDRSLLIEPAEIPADRRRSEEGIWQDLAAAAPRILGGLLDVLATALRTVSTVNVSSLPRMADFARWGEAVARALGYPDGKFLAAYGGNIDGVVRDVIDSDPVASAVFRFAKPEPWEGTPTDLYRMLRPFAGVHDPHDWPRSPDALGRRLKLVNEPLRKLGVAVSAYRTSDAARQRRIVITRVAEGGRETEPRGVRSVQSARGGNPDRFPSADS